ncbi:unnamed protein product [Penicillium salamii]|uniref:Zn(2)-C6 fungal-type domain-containing protein n=1 Tax=Penicillium salamii TaxID=1612424 RepID=A0A9W4NRT4_9EURO|nr:unnamed protein product [Penicillium salamii]CAG8050887.1 unnamed protein product [Penicillium salamii]CAG8164847.1 unnamed protein product [Penicillium salamii]CAG8207138.1 unnamed protein product [Penicillium salamii]CAG8234176.1 unnamed protein product [Penicillium salamii]
MVKRKRNWTDEESETLPSAQNAADNKEPAVLDVLPGITRKITACGACRKQKIKCDMSNGPPCTRCRRRDLSCVLNKSLQSLVEEVKNTEILQSDISGIHETLDNICQHLNLPRPKALLSSGEATETDDKTGANDDLDRDNEDLDGCEISPPDTPSAVQAPIDTYLDIAKLGSPGSSENTPPSTTKHRHHSAPQDLISKGVISIAVAEKLIERYFARLDPYLYGICSGYQSLQQIRATSPVLLAAICTVSALQDPEGQRTYEACNREFRRLVSRSLFEKHDLEHVRALCISSFWLSDASRILSSDAIRRAADMRLHRSFEHLSVPMDPRLVAGSHAAPQSFHDTGALQDRVRLWYLTFISDQHLSILHNRDPLLRSDKEIALSWETFLAREDTTDCDVRIISQVALLVIMSQVRDLLGSDQGTRVPQSLSNQIIHYSRQLDRWFTKFSSIFKPDPYIGDFPKRGLQLHYHFGKLYLGHQVFKGLNGEMIPPHFLTAAGMAHEAAVAIFEMILHENLQKSLIGMPHYFHIMIAFAGHFLLEVTQNYLTQLSIAPSQNFELIQKVLELFQDIPAVQQHPICRMTPGLTRKLRECVGILQGDGRHVLQPLSTSMDYTDNPLQIQPQGGFSFPEDSLVNPADDFLLADFGEFTFPGMMSNGMT